MRTALEAVFWLSAALLVWAQVGYAAALALAARILRPAAPLPTTPPSELPPVAVIVAAHDEAAVIARRVENLRALDYPRDRMTIVVSCDACTDDTAARAREAGADLVLEAADRAGKVRAQDAAVDHAADRIEIFAFTDANALWEPDALTRLVTALEGERVGYACGVVRFGAEGAATNQEGVYWRYEMAVRERESRLASITAGNGAIYATRREAYINVDPIMGHDLSFPFNMVKRGWRAVHVPGARATELMVPSIEGEFARKRRMMSHTWPIVLRGGMLDPRGYGVRYATMILSHRLLRYATPVLHVLALGASAALVAVGAGPLYIALLAVQVAVLGAAALGGSVRWRALLLARYYVLTTSALAAGLLDWLRHGTSASWEAAEGTR